MIRRELLVHNVEMDMLYVFAGDQGGVYRELLRAALPGWDIEAWPAVVASRSSVSPMPAWRGK
jgi:hypothetical protein